MQLFVFLSLKFLLFCQNYFSNCLLSRLYSYLKLPDSFKNVILYCRECRLNHVGILKETRILLRHT